MSQEAMDENGSRGQAGVDNRGIGDSQGDRALGREMLGLHAQAHDQGQCCPVSFHGECVRPLRWDGTDLAELTQFRSDKIVS